MPAFEESVDILRELEKELEIDKSALDVELVQQPTLYYKIASEHIEAQGFRDAADHALKVTEAKVDQAIRVAAQSKPPETQIKSMVELDPAVQKVMKEALAWRELTNHWAALRDACKQRGDVLSDLRNLYVAGYFGSKTGTSERLGALDEAAATAQGAAARERRKKL